MYVSFSDPEVRAAETRTITPGVHADFDQNGKLIGIEVIDASEIVGNGVEFCLSRLLVAAND